MFVINTVAADARVIKEAATLGEAGHEVSVIGMREPPQPERETIEGFTVIRVRRDPVPRAIAGPGRPPGRLRQMFEPLTLAVALLDYYVRALRAAL